MRRTEANDAARCLGTRTIGPITELLCAKRIRLDRLGAYGLVPGSLIRLKQIQPALILKIGETVLTVDRDVARDILVRPVQAQ